MSRRGRCVAALTLVACLGACGPSFATPTPPTPPRHVFVIVMENHSAAQALTGVFTASLAATFGVADNYQAIAHPSVPNYLALTSGQTWGITDDGYHVLARQDLGDQLTEARVTWRAYMEGLVGNDCLGSPLPYDPGHNPFAFYGGTCPPNVVPLSAQASDLAAVTPGLSWITPDRCHDTHDCAVAVGDDWLRQEVGAIKASRAWQSDGVIFITWDEDSGNAGNYVLTVVVTPNLGHRVSHRAYTHYSLLATVEDLLRVPRLGKAAQAQAMNDLVT